MPGRTVRAFDYIFVSTTHRHTIAATTDTILVALCAVLHGAQAKPQNSAHKTNSKPKPLFYFFFFFSFLLGAPGTLFIYFF